MRKRWIVSMLVGVGLALFLVPVALADVTEFPLPHAESRPYTIVAGPDGNLWFTESDAGRSGASRRAGTITEFTLDAGQRAVRDHGRRRRQPVVHRAFPNQIGKITPQGLITEYPIPTPNAQPWDITALPNGDLWFTEENVDQVGRHHQSTATSRVPDRAGPVADVHRHRADGNVWFTEELGNNIVRLTQRTPTIRRVSAPHRGRAPVGHQPGA